jgi:hypothetical protein
MEEMQSDEGEQLTLDGNAIAGLLSEIFGTEITTNPAECVHCGTVSVVGRMLAFGQEMGTVLRCPGCQNVMIRVVETPTALWLDMQGVSYLQLKRAAA